MRARYEFELGEHLPGVLAGRSGIVNRSSLNEAGNTANQFLMPSWTVFDAAIGVAKESWRLELYVHNLTDENKSVFTTNRQFIVSETPMRPRTVTIRLGYNFGNQ